MEKPKGAGTRVNTSKPIGSLAKYLEALTREQIWFAVVIATASIAAEDAGLPGVKLVGSPREGVA